MNTQKKPLLVLDLDNTLIYCHEKPYREAQLTTPHGHVSFRDGLIEFIKEVSIDYDLLVWSNSGPEYVKDMLSLFWPNEVPLVDVFFSTDSRIKASEGMGFPFFKDMKAICKRHPEYNLSKIVGVDDKPETYSANYGNVIAVHPFTGEPDNELQQLSGFLKSLCKKENFRKIEKRYWRSQCRIIADPSHSL
jgi:TFIIF-interacting CTD phosphatase-like protein